MVMSKDNSFLYFMAGALAGAVAGLLLAPDSGRNTRAKIRKGASDMADKMNCRMKDDLENLEDALEDE